MLNLHANYYINKPKAPYLSSLFQCDICACFFEQRDMIHGGTVDNATLIYSYLTLKRSLFEVFTYFSVENPTSHKYIVSDNNKILTADYSLQIAKTCPMGAH
jgi:hypothetical protein